jgi:uncharacterized protein YbjT (DUF2867 family)
MKNQDVILVTGATGQQGGAVARELLAKGRTVRAMTRKPESGAAKALAKLGAQIVVGDLDDVASLERALDGAWGVFGLQNTWEAGVEREEEQGKRLVDVARKKGITHYVYSSVGSAHRKTGIPHFDNKWRVEERLRAAGFPSHVVLRPVFLMENWTSPWFYPAIQEGRLAVALKPSTALQMIAVADVGRYGAWAFEKHEELNGRAIDIAGDQKTMPETARILSEASGRTVRFTPVPIEEVRKQSEDFALMLEWFDRGGYEADVKATSSESGVEPTSLSQWARSRLASASAVQ